GRGRRWPTHAAAVVGQPVAAKLAATGMVRSQDRDCPGFRYSVRQSLEQPSSSAVLPSSQVSSSSISELPQTGQPVSTASCSTGVGETDPPTTGGLSSVR